MRFVTDEAIERLMINDKNTFLTQKTWNKAMETLPTDSVTLSKEENRAQVIQSDPSYTEALKKNFKEQPRITDIAPVQVGFSILSDEVSKRSSEVQDVSAEDGHVIETDNYIDTHYSVISMSNQQHNGMGQERRDIESSAMLYVGGGTAAYVAKAKTDAAANHLALYDGKEAEQRGVETNTIYIAPEMGMTLTKDTEVGDERFSASSYFDAQTLHFRGKRRYKVDDGVKGEGATCSLSSEKLEFKTPHDKLLIDAEGFEINGERRNFDDSQVFRIEVSLEAPEKMMNESGEATSYFFKITNPNIDGTLSEVQLKKEKTIKFFDQTLRKAEDVPDITVAVAPDTCYLIMTPEAWTDKISAEAQDKSQKFYLVITNPIQKG